MDYSLKAPLPREEKMEKMDCQELVFKLTSSGDFDLQKKRLTNVAEGTENSDSVTKHQVDTLKFNSRQILSRLMVLLT